MKHTIRVKTRRPSSPANTPSRQTALPSVAEALKNNPAMTHEACTFDTFIEAISNMNACRYARMMLAHPDTSRVIELTGPNGCGKSHLLWAVKTAAEEKGLSPCFMTATQWSTDLIRALGNNMESDYFEAFSQFDMLLIDDCQFLQGRHATQETLFRFVKHFVDQHKSVMLASDSPFENLPFLHNALEKALFITLHANILDTAVSLHHELVRRWSETTGIPLDEATQVHLVVHLPRNIAVAKGRLDRLLFCYKQKPPKRITPKWLNKHGITDKEE